MDLLDKVTYLMFHLHREMVEVLEVVLVVRGKVLVEVEVVLVLMALTQCRVPPVVMVA
jgi:hypothetical protein